MENPDKDRFNELKRSVLGINSNLTNAEAAKLFMLVRSLVPSFIKTVTNVEKKGPAINSPYDRVDMLIWSDQFNKIIMALTGETEYYLINQKDFIYMYQTTHITARTGYDMSCKNYDFLHSVLLPMFELAINLLASKCRKV